MDSLRIVEQQILTKVMKELPGIADRIFMSLDEFFGKGPLIAFDAAVDPRAAWVAPVMGDMLGAKESIELAFKLMPVIGLHIQDGHGTEALKLFKEVPGVMAGETGIRQGKSQLSFDVDSGIEIYLQLIQFPRHGIQLQMTPIRWMGCVTHPGAGNASFSQVLSPF